MKTVSSVLSTMVALTTIFLLVASCGGIKKEIRAQAEFMKGNLPPIAQSIETAEKRFNDTLNSPEYAFCVPYAKRDQWSAPFEESRNDLDRINTIFADKIDPVLKRNKRKDEADLKQQIKQVGLMVEDIRVQLAEPEKRILRLAATKQQAPRLQQQARVHYQDLQKWTPGVTGAIKAAQTKYPSRSNDIQTQFGSIPTLQSLDQAMKIINTELSKDLPDYAVFATAVDEITRAHGQLTKAKSEVPLRLAELDHSYTKILNDMKVEYYLTINRTGSTSSGGEQSYTYPEIKVTEEIYTYFTDLPAGNELATFSSSAGLKPSVDSKMWAALKLDPKENWSAVPSETSFWLEKGTAKPNHRYQKIEDGKSYLTAWEPVSEEFYNQNINNLGMEILSKPYGVFESERLEQPAPAGMSYVGNSKYGEWKKEPSTGNSFWAFYGQYMFLNHLFGPTYPYYYRSDWDRWNNNYRGSRGYYGPDDNRPLYGSNNATNKSKNVNRKEVKSVNHASANKSTRTTRASTRSSSSSSSSSRSSSGGGSVRSGGSTSRGGGGGGK